MYNVYMRIYIYIYMYHEIGSCTAISGSFDLRCLITSMSSSHRFDVNVK